MECPAVLRNCRRRVIAPTLWKKRIQLWRMPKLSQTTETLKTKKGSKVRRQQKAATSSHEPRSGPTHP